MFTLASENDKWAKESQPADDRRMPCFLAMSTKSVVGLLGLLLMAPSKSVSEKYVLKTCMRGVWMVAENLCLLHLITSEAQLADDPLPRAISLYEIFFLFYSCVSFSSSSSSLSLISSIINTAVALFVLFLPSLFYLANSSPPFWLQCPLLPSSKPLSVLR